VSRAAGAAIDVDLDVAVFGSGAAGLTAALTASALGLKVAVFEKDAFIGGTTATSGGTCWVPGNHLARGRCDDSVESAARYLDAEIGEPDTDGRRAAFLASAGPAFEFIERSSELRFTLPMPYPDYHMSQPGAATGGRALQPAPFDGRRLGADFKRLRAPNRGLMILGGLMVSRPEAPLLARPWSSRRALVFATRSMLRYARDRVHHTRSTRLLLGNALVAALMVTLRNRGVEIHTETPLALLHGREGRIDGADCLHDGRRVRLRARRAVVLATGGFSSSRSLRALLAPHRAVEWHLSAPGATGDGLECARAVGAAMENDHRDPFFFMPASVMSPRHGTPYAFPHVIADRARPGVIAIDASGRRFVNEADSYHDFVVAMYERAGTDVPRAWLVCDRDFVRRYGIGLIRPVWQWLDYYELCGYVVTASTLAGLAHGIGVPGGALEETIARYNVDAARGIDTAFGRGESALNRFNGDPAVAPNPCLAPIRQPPYCAVAIAPAAAASSLGLATDTHARVLDTRGVPLHGLYACGNDQASIMRGRYPGAGITLGPAMTFAYRAIQHAAGQEHATCGH